ncbi:sensor histidine kinase [Paeniglutamicibacter gangotriensis]|uniref:histidine kinase n=1 Tax=Paeniglutamicibacter gangotriensis Lz1y TaxID=1276920 RepID=M7MUA1_9MICC|nr:histidine kinase [Paeniglutamicibacter gangotriensis]EMQ98611.1 two-component sensor histidine kinase YxjL [Paeniglutamicibacter gangotriensis Lz1y]
MKFLALRQRFLPGNFPPEGWERPQPTPELLRRDIWTALVMAAVALLGMEMMLSFGDGENTPDRALSYLATVALILPLAVRRRFPISSMLVLSAMFIGFGTWLPQVMMQLAPQVAYFAGLYSAASWARDRRALRLALSGVIITMFLWLVVGLTNVKLFFGTDLDLPQAFETTGLIDPVVAWAGYNFLVNLFYFGGAIYLGLASWRSSWQHEVVVAQAAQLREQAAELARRAVIDERLRIARELHDVVAHHISAVGVQAAAARMVQPRDPERATELMRGIEESARHAVGETRSLLRVLRHEEADGPAQPGQRSPEPSLAELPALVEQSARAGVRVELITVEHREGFLEGIGAGLGLALYRIAAESLANVREHSTARSAVLSLRSGRDDAGEWAEVEVTDDGNARPGTAGSGFGLRGITERAELHHGLVDIGPRSPAGWRTRARLRTQHTLTPTPVEGQRP